MNGAMWLCWMHNKPRDKYRTGKKNWEFREIELSKTWKLLSRTNKEKRGKNQQHGDASKERLYCINAVYCVSYCIQLRQKANWQYHKKNVKEKQTKKCKRYYIIEACTKCQNQKRCRKSKTRIEKKQFATNTLSLTHNPIHPSTHQHPI